MRNEFEKQVREKMEELNFVPSDPVWEKIEEQIRVKKDRRRLILWIPLLALLLGGGTWWLNSTPERPEDKIVSSQTTPEIIRTETQDHSLNRQSDQKTLKSDPVILTDHTRTSADEETGEKKIVTTRIKSQNLFSVEKSQIIVAGKQSTNGVRVSEQPVIAKSAAQINVSSEKPLASATTNDQDIKILPDQKMITEDPSDFKPFSRKIIPIENLILPGIEKNKTTEKVTDSHKLIVSAPVITKPVQNKNWNFGLTAALGLSGTGNGFHVFNQEKSLVNAPYSNSSVIPAVNNSGNSSPVEKNISFGFGLQAKKQLTRRLNLSTGISYKYYSTKTRVGVRINSQRATTNSGTTFFLDQNNSFYYINYGSSLQEYYNQYHIISLPFSMELQVLKNIPLSVNAGFSVNQLVKTTALKYDPSSQVYYYDKDAFNRTQVFADFGLNYPVIDKKISLLLGPQLGYSLNSVNKNGSSQHLYSLQLRAQLMLKK